MAKPALKKSKTPAQKSKETASSKSIAGKKVARSRSRAPAEKGPVKRSGVERESKQDRIVAMLRRDNGATIEAIMKATDWKQHSVRGFFAGVVRKKLDLSLVSDKTENGRIYRIKGRAPTMSTKVPSSV